ncbi:hypothetical protein NDU88_009743 [Pleurodeles waltl]|uniref:Uncharacterized protein n=1 Tax=Pleurodeles waltl TaxID=8319 RepID=A0AAV7QWM2_PLEWA|nr:hypothetical protein NDU88_009743 [Pleurodeles waltl]
MVTYFVPAAVPGSGCLECFSQLIGAGTGGVARPGGRVGAPHPGSGACLVVRRALGWPGAGSILAGASLPPCCGLIGGRFAPQPGGGWGVGALSVGPDVAAGAGGRKVLGPCFLRGQQPKVNFRTGDVWSARAD